MGRAWGERCGPARLPETVSRNVKLFSEKGSFERLLIIADSEPPRVRAVKCAIGEQLGSRTAVLQHLRVSPNPVSRFEFGQVSGLRHARKWQAK